MGLGGVDAIERLGDVQLGDPDGLDGPVGAAPRHRLTAAEHAVSDPAECQTADVRRRVEVRHERLQRVVVVVLGGRNVVEERLEERLEAAVPRRSREHEIGIAGIE